VLRGKVVVFNFWFIGCPACRGQEPKLNELKQKFAERDDVVFVAATADAAGEVKKYLKRERFDYLQAADSLVLIDHFSTRTYPRNIVIGRDGRIAYWRSVVHAWDKFESAIRAEIAK
jgi:thiol-disulfide isomerase/thioredoxin